jgi:hypothetical protein
MAGRAIDPEEIAAVTDGRVLLTDIPARHRARFTAIDEFVRAAREGELIVLGCPNRPGEHQLIAQSYWLGASVDPDSVFSPSGVGATIGISQNLEQLERITRYLDLYV